MVIVILGGVGRLFGPLAGAMMFILLERFIGSYTEHWMFFLGLILLGVVLFAKGGLVGVLAGRENHD
jgi:branched-chain amino acid transport system permease protein